MHSHFQVSPEMLCWAQVQTLAGPHQNFYRVFLTPLLCFLSGMLRVVVLLKCKPSSQSEILSTLEKVFAILFCIHLPLYPD